MGTAGKIVLVERKLEKVDYFDNGNGTISDKNGLMWQKEDEEDDNTERRWDDAISYCKGLSLGGYSDWRLPNREELKSIIDETRKKPTINTTYFPNTKSSHYWSSTTDAGRTTGAWSVDFYGGSVYDGHKSNNYYVRCVRDGQ